MSVLIQGVDMPKGRVAMTLDIWADGTVRLVNERVFKGQAVEIPTPHGRLIDAKELEKKGSVAWMVALQPTILEAEE